MGKEEESLPYYPGYELRLGGSRRTRAKVMDGIDFLDFIFVELRFLEL